MASCGRKDRNAASRQAFCKIIVGFAFELEVDILHKKGAKTLACRAFELDVDSGLAGVFCSAGVAFRGFTSHPGIGSLLQFLRTAPLNMPRKHGAHGTIGIAYGVIEVYFAACFYSVCGGIDDLFVQNIVQVMVL